MVRSIFGWHEKETQQMRSPIVIDQAAAGSCRSLSGSFLLPRHYAGLSMLVVMAVLFGRPDFAFAQWGANSNAEPGSVSVDADDASSGGSDNDVSANSDGSSSAGGGAVSAASGNQSGDADNLESASNGFGVVANPVKARQSRDYYFVRKLRVEFAAMELVERRTGIAFSRHDVPRYLDELRVELATMRGSASAPVQSLAHDVQHIDIELNKHIDKLLVMIGTPTNVAPSFAYGFFAPSAILAENPRCGRGKNSGDIAEI
jgi:hypothetical protein